MLLWSILLPTSKTFSIQERKPKDNKTINLATFGIIFQLFSIYFFSALIKAQHITWINGEAIYHSLLLDSVSNLQLTEYLAKNLSKDFFIFLNSSVLILEGFIPFLLFSPIKNSICRYISFILFVSLHLSFMFLFHLGLFPIICIVFWLIIIPSDFWELKLGKLISNKINQFIHFIKKEIKKTDFNIIKKYLFNIMCLLIISSTLILNLTSLEDRKKCDYPQKRSIKKTLLPKMGEAIAFKQNWQMFTFGNLKTDGWYRFLGTTQDKEKIDIIQRKIIRSIDKKPTDMCKAYECTNQRKHTSIMFTGNFDKKILKEKANFLCSEWNKKNPKKIRNVEIIYFKERNFTFSRKKPVIKKSSLIKEDCK